MKSKSLGILVVFTIILVFSITSWGAGNVIVVAESGGDFDNPIDAINSITDASRSNPYILSVSPGVYNLGTMPLYMKSHVSLVGSGQKATFIVGKVDSAVLAPDQGPGLINGADVSEIRHLTVINRNFGTAHAIHNYGASSLLISHVTAIARGGGDSSVGSAFKAGIWNDGGSRTVLEHVTARAFGTGGGSACLGLYNRDSVTRIHGSRLVANGGSINNGIAVSKGRVLISDTHVLARNSSGGINNGIAVTSEDGMESYVEIRNSVVRGSVIVANVDGSGSPAVVRIAASTVDGSVSPGPSGEIKCVGAFDSDFNPLNSDCSVIP